MVYIFKDRIIRIEWTVLKGISNAREDFSRALLKLFLIGRRERYLVEVESFDNGTVKATIPQGLEEGSYSVELIYVKNWDSLRRGDMEPHRHPVDCKFNDRCLMRTRKDDLFSITEFESEATNIGEGVVVLKVKTSTATYGYDGLSSYELAVLRGDWNGTEGEWLKHERYVSVLDSRGDSEVDTMSQKAITDELETQDNAIEDIRKDTEKLGDRVEEAEEKVNNMGDVVDEIKSHAPVSARPAGFKPDIDLTPEITVDRAWRDHEGNVIRDTYITRRGLRNEIIDITNQQVTDLKPGSVDPDDLSEATKQLIGNKSITNLPDEEDITVTDNQTLKLKDKEYAPKDYSGMGRVYLRKHYVNGVNTLTQHMMRKPNTIYIIQYDYCLAGQTIEVPENCVLEFQGGSLRNGNIIGNATGIECDKTKIFDFTIDISGSWSINFIYAEWFGAHGDAISDDTEYLQFSINVASKLNCELRLLNTTYLITRTLYLPKNSHFIGTSYGSWITDNRTTLIAVFNDILSWVIDSDNKDIYGNHVKYNYSVEGDRECDEDGTKFSPTNNIIIRNISIVTDQSIYGGCRLNLSPRSIREGMSIIGTQIGYSIYGSYGSKDINNYARVKMYGYIVGIHTHNHNMTGCYINRDKKDASFQMKSDDRPIFIQNLNYYSVDENIKTKSTGIVSHFCYGNSLIQTDVEGFDIGKSYLNGNWVDMAGYLERNQIYSYGVFGESGTRVTLIGGDCSDFSTEYMLKVGSQTSVSLVNITIRKIKKEWGAIVQDIGSSFFNFDNNIYNLAGGSSYFRVVNNPDFNMPTYMNEITLNQALNSANFNAYKGKNIVIELASVGYHEIIGNHTFNDRNLSIINKSGGECTLLFKNNNGYISSLRLNGNCSLHIEGADIETEQGDYHLNPDSDDRALLYAGNGHASFSIIKSNINLNNNILLYLKDNIVLELNILKVDIYGNDNSKFSNYPDDLYVNVFVRFGCKLFNNNLKDKNLFGKFQVDWSKSTIGVVPSVDYFNPEKINLSEYSLLGRSVYDSNKKKMYIWNGSSWDTIYTIPYGNLNSGTSENRPENNLFQGESFYDTTLGKPIWWNGTNWVDATGATV